MNRPAAALLALVFLSLPTNSFADIPGSKPSLCSAAISPRDCNDIMNAATIPVKFGSGFRITAIREIMKLPGGDIIPNAATIAFIESDPRDLPRRISAGCRKAGTRWTCDNFNLGLGSALLTDMSFEDGEKVFDFIKSETSYLDTYFISSIRMWSGANRIRATDPKAAPVRFTLGLASADRKKDEKRLIMLGERETDGKLFVIEDILDDSEI